MIISTKSLLKIISNSYTIIILLLLLLSLLSFCFVLFFHVYMRLNLKIFDDLQKRYAK